MTSKILPKSSKEFARKEYWDKFFAIRNKAFEWYGNYDDLKDTFGKYMKTSDDLLIIGCGNSSLSADMYDHGYTNNTSVDISKIVIDKMIQKYGKDRSGLKFEEMNVFDLKYDDCKFNAVIDKGTLDALKSDTDEDVNMMFDQIDRVLKPMGKYICISLLQEDVLKSLLDRFIKNSNQWLLRIHRVNIEESSSISQLKNGGKTQKSNKESQKQQLYENDLVDFPVFAVVITKLLKPMPFPVDVYFGQDGHSTRCSTIQNVTELIDSLQKIEFMRYYVRNPSSDNFIAENDTFCTEIFHKDDPKNWRYSFYFAKKSIAKPKKCAVFIVPLGEEHEWIYSTANGREELRRQCSIDWLIVVHCSRFHSFDNITAIKDELSPEVLAFFPKSLQNETINFLSVGAEVGERTQVHKDTSPLSGELVVEDVYSSDNKKAGFRRLIFLSNSKIIQSEGKILSKNKKIDHEFLSCEHHKIICVSLSIMKPILDRSKKLLLVGLGGGGLVSFLTKKLSNEKLDIIVVEIDPIIVKIAKDWFGFNDNKAKVVLADGLEYIRSIDGTKDQFDFIVFDVDSKDSTLGVSCPPAEFVTENFLHIVHSKLSPNGIFILNLVARDSEAKEQIYSRLKKQFATIFRLNVENDLNEILLAFKEPEAKYSKIKSEEQRLKYLTGSDLYIPLLEKSYKTIAKKKSLFL